MGDGVGDGAGEGVAVGMAVGGGASVGVEVGAGGVTSDAATKASTVAWRSTDRRGSPDSPHAARRVRTATDASPRAQLRTVARAPAPTPVQPFSGIKAVRN